MLTTKMNSVCLLKICILFMCLLSVYLCYPYLFQQSSEKFRFSQIKANQSSLEMLNDIHLQHHMVNSPNFSESLSQKFSHHTDGANAQGLPLSKQPLITNENWLKRVRKRAEYYRLELYFKKLAHNSPLNAIHEIQSLSGNVPKEVLIAMVMSIWMTNDPVGAMEWVSKSPKGIVVLDEFV